MIDHFQVIIAFIWGNGPIIFKNNVMKYQNLNYLLNKLSLRIERLRWFVKRMSSQLWMRSCKINNFLNFNSTFWESWKRCKSWSEVLETNSKMKNQKFIWFIYRFQMRVWIMWGGVPWSSEKNETKNHILRDFWCFHIFPRFPQSLTSCQRLLKVIVVDCSWL
jgi:hypothetical protein